LGCACDEEETGAAQGRMFQKVQILEVASAIVAERLGEDWTNGDGGNLRGQADLNYMARFATFREAQDAAGDEPADGPAHGVATEADTASEPGNGKPELKLSFQAAVAEKMRIDDAVGDFHTRSALVFFDFHGIDPRRELQSVKGQGFWPCRKKTCPKRKTPRRTPGRTFPQKLVHQIIRFSQRPSSLLCWRM
jgi:hypothetical protein